MITVLLPSQLKGRKLLAPAASTPGSARMRVSTRSV
jgi:hypothetical protein